MRVILISWEFYVFSPFFRTTDLYYGVLLGLGYRMSKGGILCSLSPPGVDIEGMSLAFGRRFVVYFCIKKGDINRGHHTVCPVLYSGSQLVRRYVIYIIYYRRDRG